RRSPAWNRWRSSLRGPWPGRNNALEWAWQADAFERAWLNAAVNAVCGRNAVTSSTRIARLISTVLLVLMFANPAQPQHAQKPLTNDDVIAMVHKKLPESVIVSAIQAGP